MDIMQGMLKFLKNWITRLRTLTEYLKESFLPDEETQEESNKLIWWF